MHFFYPLCHSKSIIPDPERSRFPAVDISTLYLQCVVTSFLCNAVVALEKIDPKKYLKEVIFLALAHNRNELSMSIYFVMWFYILKSKLITVSHYKVGKTAWLITVQYLQVILVFFINL